MTKTLDSVQAQGGERRAVYLGPLFTAGALLLAYGLLRRKPLAVAAGIGAVWLDQRSELGRSLKDRFRAGTNVVVLSEGQRAEESRPAKP